MFDRFDSPSTRADLLSIDSSPSDVPPRYSICKNFSVRVSFRHIFLTPGCHLVCHLDLDLDLDFAYNMIDRLLVTKAKVFVRKRNKDAATRRYVTARVPTYPG